MALQQKLCYFIFESIIFKVPPQTNVCKMSHSLFTAASRHKKDLCKVVKRTTVNILMFQPQYVETPRSEAARILRSYCFGFIFSFWQFVQ